MSRFAFTVTAILAALAATSSLSAIEVEGEVSGNWTIDDSPVSVVDTIFVPENEALTIDPGVIVNFSGPFPLLVQGELLAEGTEEDSIIFHPVDEEFWCGIRAESRATVTLRFCVLRDSRVGDEETPMNGGSLYFDDVELIISHSTFSGNRCSRWGGAIYFQNGSTSIESNLFMENSAFAENDGPKYGGAIFIDGDNSTIADNTFLNNSSGGGGALAVYADAQIMNNTFIGNSAVAGGAVFTAEHLSEDCVISGNTFIGNSARSSGGALEISQLSSIVVHHNIFSRNNAGGFGGAVAVNGYMDIGEFYSNTIVFNECDLWGGGICLLHNSGIVIVNCIMWGNRSGDGAQISFDERLQRANLYYCVIEGDWHEEHGEHLIHEDPQFVDPDNNDFHLTENSPCIDAGDPDSPRDPDRTRADMGAYYYPQQPFLIPLHAGWQMVSSPVAPRNPDMEDVFDYIVQHGMQPMVKDHLGRFFFPPMGFNNMAPWDLRYGYLVRMDAPDTLAIAGQPVPVDTPILMQNGWSIVAYFPEQRIPAPDAFANIADALDIAKDDVGNFYLPRYGFCNMISLRRGEGYQVRVSSSCELVWNVQEQVAGLEIESNLTPSINPTITDRNMSLLIVQSAEFIQNSKFKTQNSQIAAFNSDGLLVGVGWAGGVARKVAGGDAYATGLAVWGDDPSTEEVDGLQEGEAFELRLGNDPLQVTRIYAGPGMVYATDEFTVLEAAVVSVLPADFSLSEAFPNPFNSVTKISYGLPEASRMSIRIYDISGRMIATLVEGDIPAGNHAVTWDAGSVATGVYLVQMEASRTGSSGGFSAVRKLTLLR